MTRIIDRPAEVTMGPGGVPVSFRFAGERFRVEAVLDCWVERGRWWEQENEVITYRVATRGGGVYELTWDPTLKRWYLYKAYD
jgi:hypothetical protein